MADLLPFELLQLTLLLCLGENPPPLAPEGF